MAYIAPPTRRRRLLPYAVVAVVTVVAIALARWVSTGADVPSLLGCPGCSVQLSAAAAPKKSGLMRQFAEERSGPRSGEGRVEASVVEQSSGPTLDALSEGDRDEAEYGARPRVWTPAGSGRVGIARDRAAAAGNASLIPAEAPSAAHSPPAEALGRPQESPGWSALLEPTDSEGGRGSRGHPERGGFRMGETNPGHSTSGLNATIGTCFAATGSTSDPTTRNIEDSETRTFVGGGALEAVGHGAGVGERIVDEVLGPGPSPGPPAL